MLCKAASVGRPGNPYGDKQQNMAHNIHITFKDDVNKNNDIIRVEEVKLPTSN